MHHPHSSGASDRDADHGRDREFLFELQQIAQETPITVDISLEHWLDRLEETRHEDR